MEENERHTIWQDAVYENEADWLDAYEEDLNINEQNGTESAYDNIGEYIAHIVNEQLHDERDNLDIDVPEGIISIAKLGLWNGSRTAYHDTEFNNVNECLRSFCHGLTYMKFYVDGTDFRAEEAHHDGTNFYTFRKWKQRVTDSQKQALKNALYNQDEDKAWELIEDYTESLRPLIAKVYGW